jgi:2-methylcitrate dehydratase PrpD
MNATERMAGFIVDTRLDDIPEQAIHMAKRSVIDTMGVALAAGAEPVAKNVSAYVRGMSKDGPATVIGAGLRCAPPWAALANGTLGHALDFDDSNWSLMGHGTVAVLPAALAQGEDQNASGRDIIEAFIVGFEVASKLGRGMNMGLYDNGWHPTSTLGAMGAAAAAAHLRGLDTEKTRFALGIAASHASGVRANFGTMTKPLHAGLAAESGVRAAGLAAAGITANPDILEAKSGYCEAFAGAGNYRLEEITESLGAPFIFEDPGVNLKPYPCCMSAHPSIDALRELIAEGDLTPDSVDEIDVALMEPNFLNLSYHNPQTGLEGKFSGEYALSRILMDGNLNLNTFTDDAVNEPAVRETMSKVHVHLAENVEWTPGSARPATVTVKTTDGRTLQKTGAISRGNAALPLTDEEVHAKFMDCAAQTISSGLSGKVLSMLVQLENEPDIRALMSLVA